MSDIQLKNINLELIKPNSRKAKRLDVHIRKNKIAGHYAIIIGEDGNTYLYLPMTTHELGRNVSMELNPNPNRKSSKSSFVIFRMRANKKSAFTAPFNWQLSNRDLAIIIKYAKSKIK